MKLSQLMKLHSVRVGAIAGAFVTTVGVLQANNIHLPSWVLISVGLVNAFGVASARNISQPDVTGK